MPRTIINKLPTYNAVHKYLLYNYGNATFCIWNENHIGRFEWANVTGEYTRELEDYLPMCASCHRKFDVTTEFTQKISARSKNNSYAVKSKVGMFLDKNLIQTFSSAQKASRKLGVSPTLIHRCIVEPHRKGKGYSWKRL